MSKEYALILGVSSGIGAACATELAKAGINIIGLYMRKPKDQIEQLRHLGDQSIEFEEQITRIYPQRNLFSHIIGQIDDDNNGISGIEKFFDYELKKKK